MRRRLVNYISLIVFFVFLSLFFALKEKTMTHIHDARERLASVLENYNVDNVGKVHVQDYSGVGANFRDTPRMREDFKLFWDKRQKQFEKCYNVTLTKDLNDVIITSTNEEEIFYIMQRSCMENLKLRSCSKYPILNGPLAVRTDDVTLEYLHENEVQFVRKGGWWSPLNCIEEQKTAILIPYRNRRHHIPILLRHLHPILRRKQIHYRIFVIEQDDKNGFNRAKLFNVGFSEVGKIFPFMCFVFHDVDLIPENDRIDYSCKKSPKHLSAGVSTFNYVLFSDKLFGGVTMFTQTDFNRVNGFSNMFWVWGGEDDELYERTVENKMKIHREATTIGRYKMLDHVSQAKTRSDQDYQNMKRFMKLSRKHSKEDGLNSLVYKVNEIHMEQLYTLIKVDLLREQDRVFS